MDQQVDQHRVIECRSGPLRVSGFSSIDTPRRLLLARMDTDKRHFYRPTTCAQYSTTVGTTSVGKTRQFRTKMAARRTMFARA